VVSIGNVDVPYSTSRMLMDHHSNGDGDAFCTYIFETWPTFWIFLLLRKLEYINHVLLLFTQGM